MLHTCVACQNSHTVVSAADSIFGPIIAGLLSLNDSISTGRIADAISQIRVLASPRSLDLALIAAIKAFWVSWVIRVVWKAGVLVPVFACFAYGHV